MLKENGRAEPADKNEIANLKGKSMRCPKCGDYLVISKAEFAATKCGRCGTQMQDASWELEKASGK